MTQYLFAKRIIQIQIKKNKQKQFQFNKNSKIENFSFYVFEFVSRFFIAKNEKISFQNANFKITFFVNKKNRVIHDNLYRRKRKMSTKVFKCEIDEFTFSRHEFRTISQIDEKSIKWKIDKNVQWSKFDDKKWTHIKNTNVVLKRKINCNVANRDW